MLLLHQISILFFYSSPSSQCTSYLEVRFMLIDFDLYGGFHTIQKSTCCRRLPPDPVLHLQAVEEPEKEVSDAKRSKSGEEGNGIKKEKEEGNLKPTKENAKPEPPRDYIHVRARRGQATDCHSLAERVRREKDQ
ncbi:putative basic helix-loop-helix leucine zipper transcription factor [Helianthus annuus]|uniref:Basic helix-loop-helix leucine zipper transcription factor n=1 Tax=Helianthus annuus TaxID=4232 RepID=A0A9K3EGE3_HELAN|nr:putative basic helix-loop-helix leucine zipper transcription factor [Helianthus annuus]KAJ0475574.1 putative basic helix-loop-helix leucine zipper transcription factor [Helianthus annuus]KAJ0496355.1 putative basic helix-loop-helix leucine zipper transcription factor [Helianthus annuus]KAJ0662416.1 putative basic helix-loop-helix leucine zipper transcription factor [Helianthus annuus]KAJ0669943.1 putative basic helix-loop-helix leucine zipper transcription factor [Helianthus annuus]